MQNKKTAEEQREPPKLKLILPLVGLILLLSLIFTIINLSRSDFEDISSAELLSSFNEYTSQFGSLDHFKLSSSEKQVSWSKGPQLTAMLKNVEKSELVESVGLRYNIPIFINLTGDWFITLKDKTVDVSAPMPNFGEAVFDPGSLEITYSRDPEAEQKQVIEDTLKERFSTYKIALDFANREALEAESRLKVEGLIKEWLEKTFSNVPELKYNISFTGSTETEFTEEP